MYQKWAIAGIQVFIEVKFCEFHPFCPADKYPRLPMRPVGLAMGCRVQIQNCLVFGVEKKIVISRAFFKMDGPV